LSAIQQAGYTQTIQAVSSIISPGAAAFLYSVWPLNAVILLDIAGVVLALNALLLWFTEPCPTIALIVLFKSTLLSPRQRRPLLLSAKVTQKHF
jgi:hypothetical protein